MLSSFIHKMIVLFYIPGQTAIPRSYVNRRLIAAFYPLDRRPTQSYCRIRKFVLAQNAPMRYQAFSERLPVS